MLWIGDDGQLLDVLEKPKDSDQILNWIQTEEKFNIYSRHSVQNDNNKNNHPYERQNNRKNTHTHWQKE